MGRTLRWSKIVPEAIILVGEGKELLPIVLIGLKLREFKEGRHFL